LGLSRPRLATLQYPHSYVALQYCQYLIDTYREMESKGTAAANYKLRPILKLLKVQLQDESNVYHVFALNENFLKSMTTEIKYQYIDLDYPNYLAYIYYVLLPSNTSTKIGRRPFSIALKQYSPKCLEQMLESLMIDKKQDYMRYMERYLSKLLSMKSLVFYKFLDVSCKRFQFRMQGTLRKDTIYLLKQTQYINRTTFMKSFMEEVKARKGGFFGCLNCFKRRRGPLAIEDGNASLETSIVDPPKSNGVKKTKTYNPFKTFKKRSDD
jgi:hypothetical protein